MTLISRIIKLHYSHKKLCISPAAVGAHQDKDSCPHWAARCHWRNSCVVLWSPQWQLQHKDCWWNTHWVSFDNLCMFNFILVPFTSLQHNFVIISFLPFLSRWQNRLIVTVWHRWQGSTGFKLNKLILTDWHRWLQNILILTDWHRLHKVWCMIWEII